METAAVKGSNNPTDWPTVCAVHTGAAALAASIWTCSKPDLGSGLKVGRADVYKVPAPHPVCVNINGGGWTT